MKVFSTLCAALCLSVAVWGQTVVASQGFENSAADTWSISSGAGGISTTPGSSDFPENERIRTGTASWQVNDATQSLELAAFPTTGYESMKVKISLSSTAGTSGNGADGTDNVAIYLATDGSTFPGAPDITIAGNGNAKWGYAAYTASGNGYVSTAVATGTAGSPQTYAPSGGGYREADGYHLIEIDIPATPTSVALRIEATNNSDKEFWNIDDIELIGTLSVTNPEPTNQPTNLLADTGAPSESVIDLIWDDATAGQAADGYLIKSSTSNTFTDPVDGTDPAQDTDLSDGSALVKVPQGIGFYSFSGLSPGTTYYFKMWPYTNAGANIDFKTDGTPQASDATTDALPTIVRFAQPTGSVNEGGGTFQICVDIENPSPTVATSAQIVFSSASSSPGAEANDIGNNTSLGVNFPAGSSAQQCATVSITDDATQEGNEDFVFDLHNVNGGNAAVEGLPNQFTLTIVDNEVPKVLITKVIDAADSGGPKAIVITNRGNSPVDISGWSIRLYANGSTGFNTADVDGAVTLAPNASYALLGSSPSFDIDDCAGSTTSGSISGNGDDVYELFDGSTSIDIYGVIGTDGSGEPWEYEDALATRNLAITTPTTSFDISQWSITPNATILNVGSICGASPPLPIALTAFGARPSGEAVALYWQTATELNNDYMAVERSADGRAFTEIGRVAGAGTTQEAQEYQFTDRQPLPGRSYYRLRQADFDGQAEYHGPVAVTREGGKATLSLYPTIAQGQVQVQFGGLSGQSGSLQLIGADGRVWLTQPLPEGTAGQLSISTTHLPAGLYWARLQGGQDAPQARLIVR